MNKTNVYLREVQISVEAPITCDSKPDITLNIISYLGYPIKWPDNEFKYTIEADLSLLVELQKLKYYSEMDVLTHVYNRRKSESLAFNEFNRSSRSGF